MFQCQECLAFSHNHYLMDRGISASVVLESHVSPRQGNYIID